MFLPQTAHFQDDARRPCVVLQPPREPQHTLTHTHATPNRQPTQAYQPANAAHCALLRRPAPEHPQRYSRQPLRLSGVYRHSNRHAPRNIPKAQCAFKVLMIHWEHACLSACKLHSTEEAVSSTFAGVRGRVDAAAHNARRWLADRPGSVGDWASRACV